MKLKKFFFTLAVLCFSFSGCAQKLPVEKIYICRQDGTKVPVKVEVAKTAEQRNRGFMERKYIPDGTGMIFVFEKDQILSFWMKNTPHPLSIAFIDSNGKIRDIFQMTPYSLSSVSSTTSVRYALEVPQGWFKKEGIKEGDYLTKEK